MKCQILFLRKNKKNIISLLATEFASSRVSVKAADTVKPALKATCIKQSPVFKRHYFRSQ